MNPGDFGEVSYEVSVANSANSNDCIHTPSGSIRVPYYLTFALCHEIRWRWNHWQGYWKGPPFNSYTTTPTTYNLFQR